MLPVFLYIDSLYSILFCSNASQSIFTRYNDV